MLFIFLGDSITQGLGVSRYGNDYANLLKEKLDMYQSEPVDIVNFGASAMQISESSVQFEKKIIELSPSIVVIAHGITESVVREQKKYLKYLPRRWRKPGWMDPRPYYSSKSIKKCVQQIESELRWRCKVTLIKLFGGKPWMSKGDFKINITEFIQKLLTQNENMKIILLTPSDIEGKYYPGSPESMMQYREVLRDVHEQFKKSNRVFMCDSSNVLNKWEDYFNDRFHPNEMGHNKIAEALLDTIIKNGLLVKQKILKEVSV